MRNKSLTRVYNSRYYIQHNNVVARALCTRPIATAPGRGYMLCRAEAKARKNTTVRCGWRAAGDD